ncbi:hypothetical protein HDU85_005010 [Gaertneriomyces sp. JEL0708]|nr:hypothetical protein HDU85_005010 [Gaertneriomyces sp. JEL0708]
MGKVKLNSHLPNVSKIGRATIHSPLPDSLSADLAKATSILEHFIKGTNKADQSMIPPKVIAKAKGIAVITILKAGFVWSGRAGSGIVVARLPDGRWSAPAAIAAAGAGFGAQIGAQLTDCVFILNNDAAVKAFSHGGNLTLGGNMSVAAGPKGRSVEGAGSVMNFAPIYSYSKSKGLFAGVSLEGSVILTRNDANRDLYGRKVTAKELLSGEVSPPVQAEALYRILNYKFANLGTGIVPMKPGAEMLDTSGPKRSSTMGGGSRVGIAAAAAGTDVQRSASLGTAGKRAPPPPPGMAKPAVTTATALYDFNGERESDLSFRKGDTITVIKSGGEADWWVGELNGKRGDFPGNYVRL